MRTLIVLSFLALGLGATAQTSKTATLAIQSSAVCEMCVETIQNNLIYEKGVKKVMVDLTTSIVHVEYDAKKNTPEGLRTALVSMGYSADGVAADAKAFAKLPACCQKEGCGKMPEKQ